MWECYVKYWFRLRRIEWYFDNFTDGACIHTKIYKIGREYVLEIKFIIYVLTHIFCWVITVLIIPHPRKYQATLFIYRVTLIVFLVC